MVIYDAVLRIRTPKGAKLSDADHVIDILKGAYGKLVDSIGQVESKELLIGINFDITQIIDTGVIRGPHPKSEDAKEFVDFWKGKSTIHRFPDGSLAEGITLKTDQPIIEIATLALSLHYNDKVTVDLAPRDLSPIFQVFGEEPPAADPISAFDELSTKLVGLKDSTVSITNVLALSPYLRNTAVFPAMPYDISRKSHCLCAEPIKIIIKLEGLTAWPTRYRDLVQYKIAVFIDIHRALKKQNIQSLPTTEGLDILYRGYVFSAYAYHNAELEDFRGLPHGNEIERIEKVDLLEHSTVRATCQRYSSYGEATRAAIRWVRSKCIPAQVLSQEAIELLVAHVYERETAPRFAYTGFLRFLDLLSGFSTKHSNVIPVMGSSASIAPDDNRLLIVVSSFCKNGEFTPPISHGYMSLLKNCAAAALKAALSNQFGPQVPILKSVFGTPTKHWGYSITLDCHERPHPSRALFTDRKLGTKYNVTGEPPKIESLFIDFDPVRAFVEEIASRFGDVVTIWYNEFGGPVIGLTIEKPVADKKLPAVPENLKMAKLNADGTVSVDIDAIIAQIKLLGGNMVTDISKK